MHRCMLAASRVFIVDHFGGADATVGLRCVCVCVCVHVLVGTVTFQQFFDFFQNGGHPPSGYTRVWTTDEEYLLVFLIVQGWLDSM